MRRAETREAGRLTMSSRRAAAQPKAASRARAVTDHRIGGVDRLVEGGARQSRDGEPDRRRDDAVRKILRQALDGGAGDPGLVEAFGIAPDDRRDRNAAAGDAFAFKGDGDPLDMLEKAFLREQVSEAASARGTSPADPQGAAGEGERHRDGGGRGEEKPNRHGASAAADASADSSSRLKKPSRRSMSRPIQVTGWPIASYKRSG